MRGKRNFPIFMGYALASLLVLGFLVRQMGGEFFLASVYRVGAVFTSGTQLVPGDDVTISGFRVGKVETLQPSSNGTLAMMVIHSQYGPVTDDARAVIKSKNLLGETYIELTRGSGAAMPDGGRIGIDHTLTPVELSQLLDALQPTVRDRLVLMINSLGDATAGRGPDLNTQAGDLRAVAADIATISRTVANSAEKFDRLLISLGKILETLAAYHAEFRSLVADWDRLMVALASHEADLKGTFVEDARVMAIFDEALAGGSAPGLHDALAAAPAALNNTNRFLDRGTQVYGDLQPVVPDIDTVFQRLASAFSATDSQGNHQWRVYCSGGCFQPGVATPPTPGGH